jgi:hypothetical protein
MRGLPFLPWFASDWLASSARVDMSLPARAIFLDLLFCIWERGGAIPLDHGKLSKLAMVSPEQLENVWPELREHFIVHPVELGMITNEKMLTVMAKQIARHETNVRKGREGGLKSAGNRRAKTKPGL